MSIDKESQEKSCSSLESMSTIASNNANTLNTEMQELLNLGFQIISQQDLFNIIIEENKKCIVHDLRSKAEFDKIHIINSTNLDILSIRADFNLIKGDKILSADFLKQIPCWMKIQEKQEVFIYLIYDLNSNAFINDLCQIFANFIQPVHIFILDVEFNVIQSNYSVVCSSTSDQKKRQNNLFRIPNEIISDLFLGGYNDASKMVNIIRELQITHVLNCADDFAPGSDGKSLMEYKVPEGVIVHHMDMEDGDEQQINFSESYQFIDDALNGCQKQSPQQSSSSSSSSFIVHRPRIFVHCFAGVSRSASVVIGYMMEKYHLTLAKAFEITFHQRSKIFPNAGFLKQLYLKEYELVDQFGVEDQQLKQLLQKDDNLINAIEIELGKELHTLIKLQDISRLPLQTDDYLDTMKYIHKTSYQEAKKIWEMRKFDKEKEIKKQQDD